MIMLGFKGLTRLSQLVHQKRKERWWYKKKNKYSKNVIQINDNKPKKTIFRHQDSYQGYSIADLDDRKRFIYFDFFNIISSQFHSF